MVPAVLREYSPGHGVKGIGVAVLNVYEGGNEDWASDQLRGWPRGKTAGLRTRQTWFQTLLSHLQPACTWASHLTWLTSLTCQMGGSGLR